MSSKRYDDFVKWCAESSEGLIKDKIATNNKLKETACRRYCNALYWYNLQNSLCERELERRRRKMEEE